MLGISKNPCNYNCPSPLTRKSQMKLNPNPTKINLNLIKPRVPGHFELRTDSYRNNRKRRSSSRKRDLSLKIKQRIKVAANDITPACQTEQQITLEQNQVGQFRNMLNGPGNAELGMFCK